MRVYVYCMCVRTYLNFIFHLYIKEGMCLCFAIRDTPPSAPRRNANRSQALADTNIEIKSTKKYLYFMPVYNSRRHARLHLQSPEKNVQYQVASKISIKITSAKCKNKEIIRVKNA